MTGYFWNYAARKPRHSAAPADKVAVHIERLPGFDPVEVPCQLCDVSRTGAQTRSAVPLQAGESCDLHISVKDAQLKVVLPATIRWSRQEPETGEFLTGFLFPVETSYETLGELFLNGVLVAAQQEDASEPGN